MSAISTDNLRLRAAYRKVVDYCGGPLPALTPPPSPLSSTPEPASSCSLASCSNISLSAGSQDVDRTKPTKLDTNVCNNVRTAGSVPPSSPNPTYNRASQPRQRRIMSGKTKGSCKPSNGVVVVDLGSDSSESCEQVDVVSIKGDVIGNFFQRRQKSSFRNAVTTAGSRNLMPRTREKILKEASAGYEAEKRGENDRALDHYFDGWNLDLQNKVLRKKVFELSEPNIGSQRQIPLITLDDDGPCRKPNVYNIPSRVPKSQPAMGRDVIDQSFPSGRPRARIQAHSRSKRPTPARSSSRQLLEVIVIDD